MKVINPNKSVLTNFEVLQILNGAKEVKKKSDVRNLATITYETIHYLEETLASYQTRESILQFMTEMKQYSLSKKEVLSMINDPPTSPLHIQLLVDASEARLSETQVQEILDSIVRNFLSDNST